MAKFRVGDRVKLRFDLEVGRYYDGLEFLESMTRFTGMIGTVLEVSESGSLVVNFGSDDEYNFYFRECMLERVDKEENSMLDKIRNGALVRMTDGNYFIALIGGVYKESGVLHGLRNDDLWELSEEDTQDNIFAVYEADDSWWGIVEMLEVAQGKVDIEKYFHKVYQKPGVKELTVAEIEKLLGYSVKIVKEK